MTTPTTEPAIESRRTALLLMDFQPAVLSHLAEPAAVLESAKTALDWAREHDVKAVFVRVAFAPEDYDAIPHHHKAFGPVRQGRLFADGDPSLEIDPALEVREGDIVVRKTRFGAFSTTDLHTLLGDESIDTLVVGGISTAGVVLSTVRDASDQDYRIFVLADATADPDPEVHRVVLEKVLSHQADVITTSDLKSLIREN
ncbi:MAG TPA: isochorismatase family cysteine hydrolase [Amycolatopsis sp.]